MLIYFPCCVRITKVCLTGDYYMDKIKRLKYACYSVNVTMAIVGNLSPVLFLTFRELYGISYSLLGLLVLINFVTQLGVDLIFSFFSHKFNIQKTVRAIPYISILGFIIYALFPFAFPNNVYIGLVIGTVIFSSASGLGEVLISPLIAALPSDDPDREMSKLHSVYAWGVVFVIIVSIVFILTIGKSQWQWLALILALVPCMSAVLFSDCKLPKMDTPQKTSGAVRYLKDKGVWLMIFAIFLGGAAECTMAQWCSGYLEKALAIPKVTGDLMGVAMFAVMLGLGRSLYAKTGKNIGKVLTLGAMGATLCYLIAAISPYPYIGLLACAFTGFCVSMLWPGNLVVASSRYPESGVFIFAMMASGGDLGASVGPQLVGVITDYAITNPQLMQFANYISVTPEQLGMKLGMLCGMLFPLIGIIIYRKIWKET